MKKLFSLVLSVILSILGLGTPTDDLVPVPEREGVPTQENIELFERIFESETAWLASLQLPNGAIPMTYTPNGQVKMNPYFADFAALALLDKSDEYSDEVKKYMDWHFSHLNTAETDHNGVDGTIYDYEITLKDGEITDESIALYKKKNSYDSVDSYAATFLMVLNKYYNETGDSEYIISHSSEVQRIVNAMFAMYHKGLTIAKPEWKVKYLMDNCEVYEGAVAAAELFENILCAYDSSLESTQKKCADAAVEIAQTIEDELWMPRAGHYKVGIYKILKIIPSDIFAWNKYYPCATAQLFPIVHGLIAPNTERANMLYDRFCEEYDWANFQYDDVFYWGANLQAAVMMNDIEQVVVYMTNYAELIDTHDYPLYNADAARVCLAANMLLEKYS
ncbi:MAG: hypothetical protein IKC45_00890 [Clostridia bacterium]|nr:hypothetical protein [Clostridia bacterium]